jgi:hypothetical protein
MKFLAFLDNPVNTVLRVGFFVQKVYDLSDFGPSTSISNT